MISSNDGKASIAMQLALDGFNEANAANLTLLCDVPLFGFLFISCSLREKSDNYYYSPLQSKVSKLVHVKK